jgi:hypothetical protein
MRRVFRPQFQLMLSFHERIFEYFIFISPQKQIVILMMTSDITRSPLVESSRLTLPAPLVCLSTNSSTSSHECRMMMEKERKLFCDSSDVQKPTRLPQH